MDPKYINHLSNAFQRLNAAQREHHRTIFDFLFNSTYLEKSLKIYIQVVIRYISTAVNGKHHFVIDETLFPKYEDQPLGALINILKKYLDREDKLIKQLDNYNQERKQIIHKDFEQFYLRYTEQDDIDTLIELSDGEAQRVEKLNERARKLIVEVCKRSTEIANELNNEES